MSHINDIKKLTIIVIFHNMQREAYRTLYSLSEEYQIETSASEYQVLAIDNGSSKPIGNKTVSQFGTNFHYHYFATESQSPAEAVNYGIESSNSELIAVIVDGARMASPRLVKETLAAHQAYDNAVVASLSWHLGPDVQNKSMLEGYNQAVEDELLETASWQEDGYRLFSISTLAQSSGKGFLSGFPSECSWICVRKSLLKETGGMDERFQSPGGGLVNHDLVNRTLSQTKCKPVVILGEGVFHQYHGGVATNVPRGQHPLDSFKKEYRKILGRDYEHHKVRNVNYIGSLPDQAMKFVHKFH